MSYAVTNSGAAQRFTLPAEAEDADRLCQGLSPSAEASDDDSNSDSDSYRNIPKGDNLTDTPVPLLVTGVLCWR